MARFELNSDELCREIVLRVPLPVERPKPTPERPKTHRFRPQDVALTARILPFRTLHDLTQEEVAIAVGATSAPTVNQWERGVSVPDGMRKRHLIELLEGRRWQVLREGVVAGDELPARWDQGLRWYRRTSRGVSEREALAGPILSLLRDVRALSSLAELRESYRARSRGWAPDPTWALPAGATARLVEDCAYGMRWIELTQRTTLDPRRSLVHQMSLPDLAVSSRRSRRGGRGAGT